MNVRPSSLGLDAFGGSCSSPPAAWTPRPACDGRRRIRAWQGFRRPPRWPAPEPVPQGAEACDQPACARCGRGPWPTFYCRGMSAARRLWARSGAGCDRVASLPDRCVHGLVRDRGRGVDGQSPVGDLDADVADPFDPLDVVATMLGANLGGRLIATMGPSGSAWAEWAWAHCSWSPRPLPSAGSSPPRPASPRG